MSIEGNFSDKVQRTIRLSRTEAIRLGHDYIGTEHLLLGLIALGGGRAYDISIKMGVDFLAVKKAIEDIVRPTGATLNIGNIPLTKQAEKVLKITYLEAKLYKEAERIGTEHLLLSLLRDGDNIAAQILKQFNITYDGVRATWDGMIEADARTYVTYKRDLIDQVIRALDQGKTAHCDIHPLITALRESGRNVTEAPKQQTT